MSLPRALLLALLALAAGGTRAAEAGPVLRVAVSPANGQPFAIYDDSGHLRGGVARDIMDALGQHLALRPRYLNIPRGRVETWLRAGRVDAACFLAPNWVREPDALRWSPPLFHIQQVVVSPPDAAPVTRASALFGKRVGTLSHYVYPELDGYFADRRILRADAPSLDANVAKLERRRIDAFLFDDVQTLYAIERGVLPGNVRIDPLWTAKDPVYCAFSPAFAARVPRWSEELQRLAASGRIERWIADYTGGRQVGGSTATRVLMER